MVELDRAGQRDLTIKTDGSDFDTLLAVYKGTSVSGLTFVATNDDHSTLVTSRVRFAATAGTQYRSRWTAFLTRVLWPPVR